MSNTISITFAAPSTEIWVLSSLNRCTLFLLFFHENGMLFLLDDHALRVSLNLCPWWLLVEQQQRITTEGATGRWLRAMNAARCRHAWRAGLQEDAGGEGRRARALRRPSWRKRTWSCLVARGTVPARRARFAAAAVGPRRAMSAARGVAMALQCRPFAPGLWPCFI